MVPPVAVGPPKGWIHVELRPSDLVLTNKPVPRGWIQGFGPGIQLSLSVRSSDIQEGLRVELLLLCFKIAS